MQPEHFSSQEDDSGDHRQVRNSVSRAQEDARDVVLFTEASIPSRRGRAYGCGPIAISCRRPGSPGRSVVPEGKPFSLRM